MENQNRLYGADFVRACACLIVLAHHLAQRIDFHSPLGWEPWKVFSNGGGLGVGIFFVLSGFLLSLPFWRALDAGEGLPSLRVYFLRRAARILPGYWLALTVTFLLSFTLFGSTLDGWLLLRFLSGVFLVSDWHWLTLFPVDVNGPLWSIGFEITSYALLPFGFMALFLFGRGLPAWSKRVAFIAVIVVALMAHQAFATLVTVDPNRMGWEFGLQGGAKVWMPRFNPFSFFAMFAFGALAGGVQTLIADKRHWSMDAVCGIAVIAAFGYLYMTSRFQEGELYGLWEVPYRFPLMHALIALILIAGPSTRMVGAALDNQLTRFIATISFGIYVWHYLVLEIVRELLVPNLVYGRMRYPLHFWSASLLVVLVSVAIAVISYRYLEAPVMRWARGLESKLRRPSAPDANLAMAKPS